MPSDATIRLPQDAVALRPVRMDAKNNAFIYYEATTFPRNPRGGCEMYLRRCAIFNGEGGRDLVVDVLNSDGDIVADYRVTRKGFEYLRRTLKFKREQHSTGCISE